MMGHVPAIPESTRDSITWRLILHAEKNWPQLEKVQVTCRGAFAYAAGVLPGGQVIPLFRLRYGGSAHSFGFAIYTAARERYEDALLLTGYPTGTPQEALDTACTVHLAGLGHEPDSEPATNLRGYPLSHRPAAADARHSPRPYMRRIVPPPWKSDLHGHRSHPAKDSRASPGPVRQDRSARSCHAPATVRWQARLLRRGKRREDTAATWRAALHDEPSGQRSASQQG
jgi:hypothetical protein